MHVSALAAELAPGASFLACRVANCSDAAGRYAWYGQSYQGGSLAAGGGWAWRHRTIYTADIYGPGQRHAAGICATAQPFLISEYALPTTCDGELIGALESEGVRWGSYHGLVDTVFTAVMLVAGNDNTLSEIIGGMVIGAAAVYSSLREQSTPRLVHPCSIFMSPLVVPLLVDMDGAVNRTKATRIPESEFAWYRREIFTISLCRFYQW